MASCDTRSYPHPIIAREGWPFIAAALAVAVIFSLLDLEFLSGLAWLAVIFIVQFFRDPARKPPLGEDLITSPADGQVVMVGKAIDPVGGEERLKISVFMNVFNVHSNRSPIQGTVLEVKYSAGSFLNAAIDKASEQNERNAIVIEDARGRRLTCVQIAGLIARRILCYVKPGDAVMRGSRYGFIRFGSRVDVYLPTSAKPLVCVGDKVSAHSSALAQWGD